MVRHRAVGVEQPEGVLSAGEASGEVDRVPVTDVTGPESRVGCRQSNRRPDEEKGIELIIIS